MKKLSIILLCVLLLAAVTLTSVFATAGSAELAASADTVKPGEEVTFTLSLSNYSAMNGVTVDYTVPDGMEYVGYEWLLSNTAIENEDKANKLLLWFTTSGDKDLSQKTDVLKITYKILEPEVNETELTKTVTVNAYPTSSSGNLTTSSADCKITVSNPATSLSLNKETLALDLSGTKTAKLTATVAPENTTEALSWSSSNTKIATVGTDGTVTAVAEGGATITAKIGSLTKTCQVTVSCGHSSLEEHKATEPTCQTTGNNLYYTCKTCGDVFKADKTTATTVKDETLATVGHKGGTATCTEKAKCDWCQQPYGDTLAHTFTQKIENADHLVPGSGADCQHVKKYYYDCAVCDTISTTETFDSTTTGDHKMDTAWTTENGKHWHKCTVTGCTYTKDTGDCAGGTATCLKKAVCSTCQKEYGQLAACDFTAQKAEEKYLKSAATCTELAVYYKSCTVCGEKGTATFTDGTTLPHTFTEKIEDAAHFVAGSGADCQHAKQYYYDCVNCTAMDTTFFSSTSMGEHKMDTAWTTENGKHFRKCTVSGCTHTANEAACSGGTATCTAKAVCGTCQKEYGEMKAHAYSAQWTSTGTTDADAHYQLCVTCQSAKTNEGTHTFEWVTDTKPTEDTVGFKHEECSTCKVTRSEDTEIPKLDHVHVGITYHAPVSATCVTTGNMEYWTCSSNKCTNKYYSDADCLLELADIVTAINPDNHTGTEVRDDKAPNCYQDGYTGDTYCTATGCGKKVATGTVIPATGNHVAGNAWFSDETNHWHICTTTGCGAKVGQNAHSYQWKLDKAATEDATGLKHEECVCGVKRNEGTVIPKLDHVHVGITHHAAVKATCVKAGTVEYWTCSSTKCAGKYYGDAKCQLELETITEAINKDNHIGGTQLKDALEATCSENGYTGDTYCVSCQALVKKGEAIPATGKHTPKEGYLTDDKQHWQICSHCGALIDSCKEDHTLSWVVDQKATESAEGSKHQVCTVCGYTCSQGTVISKLQHSPTRIDGKASTCTEDGVIEHFLCYNCGRYYASVNGEPGDQITKEDTVLAAAGHAFGTEWKNDEKEHWHVCACGETADKAAHTTEVVNAKDATETETGYTGDTVCSVCEYVVEQGQEIPVIETEAPTEPTASEPAATGDKQEQNKGGATIWIVLAAVLVAAFILILIILLRRKRKEQKVS